MRLLLFTTALLGLLLAAGCRNEDAALSGSGMIEATEVTVSAQVGGQVEKLYFDEGTVIAPGDTLLVVDTTALGLELASARAGRALARTRLQAAQLRLNDALVTEAYLANEVKRIETLVAANTATRRQLDELQYRHTQAGIAVGSARSAIASAEAEIAKIDADIARLLDQWDDAFPVAPIAGTVTEKYVDAGELLAPGRPIARIARLDTVWVKIYLPAREFAAVTIGAAATVDTEAGESSPGRVTWVADQAEFTPKNVQTKKARADLVYAVEITVANPAHKLKIGQPVFVTVGE
ncbi:MAG TPA: efflux RND transporter periplasmic adaptor subunit [candidate division Zixibacteria bacterium]|nr:efflux RND transporter periplasmic adaptor subunit [candidate division Zixibacteria bacterium]MDD4917530.1 efflux RND transporter periplasmic adaptor subunit [candidate division Zixibacteria bacterium]MDM7972201.1 efflux RND transporter periplasmic adaptor subunit [candidate division Zixibacteria bacterium]HOD66756.1 efflux RND transporter periplasmic adaptor subunit [candidate division Zixibacteria bacterium]HOZ06787.1 efflux RND transporter periplasmic adaptor subunit [candidate division Z